MSKMMKQREVKKYFKVIRKNLKFSYSRKDTEQIMQSIKKNAEEFFIQHPKASFTDFEENFGTANDVSSSILQTELIYNSDSLKNMHFKRNFFKVLGITVISLALIICSLSIKFYIDIHKSIPTYGEVEIEEITDFEGTYGEETSIENSKE